MKNLTYGRPADLVIRVGKRGKGHQDLTMHAKSAKEEAWYHRPGVQIAIATVTGVSSVDTQIGLALALLIIGASAWMGHRNVEGRMMVSPDPAKVFHANNQPGGLESLRLRLVDSMTRAADDQPSDRQADSSSTSR